MANARSESPAEALKDAVATLGSQSALSRLIGVSQAAVSIWLSKGQSLPSVHVLAVEAATGISRHDLRPDIYPREPAPSSPPDLDRGSMEKAR